ncbi:MAG TPA: hypothetical protein VL981_01095 [Candidatus Methylacidiphilales bacterium]|nr:hypothetical protein [Candidatus Methylacidiphilales bacterium]
MSKTKQATDISLVPEKDFRNAVKKILSNSKQQSDKDLAKFQASNTAKREATK